MSLATDEFSTPGIFVMLVIGTFLFLGIEFLDWYGHLIVDWADKFGIDVYALPGIRELTEYFKGVGASHLP